MNPNRQATPLTLPADEVTQDDIPLELMQTSIRSRLSRMPHGRHIKEEKTEMGIGNFSLDGSSHQTEDAAFTPATPHDLRHSRANTDSQNLNNTEHTRVKKLHFALCKRTLIPARHVLEDTPHQTLAKVDAGDAFLLMGSIN